MSPTSPALCGVTTLAVGLAVLSLVAIYASLLAASRAVPPPTGDQPGRVYSCHCFDRPLRVLIVDPAAAIRIDAPPGARPDARPDAPPDARQASGRRHAQRKRRLPDHRDRPHRVSHAEADGGGEGGVRPVPAAV